MKDDNEDWIILGSGCIITDMIELHALVSFMEEPSVVKSNSYPSTNWQVTPLITFILVLLALSPCLIKAWRKPQPGAIARWIAYAYTCGFLYGWHVHEKASLHFVIPLAISAAQSLEDAKHYFLISIGMFNDICSN